VKDGVGGGLYEILLIGKIAAIKTGRQKSLEGKTYGRVLGGDAKRDSLGKGEEKF